ncbi:stage VI sporulation protein F [Paenibacillus cellulosilyticus]|uniref:Stage VI sporulation protein F n=1 Tax=Paenibacillus cellulosilyticus TaxID=375489 RepID=A0A2V2YXQ4_9BACL|nr:stage VI sporulation protein F [Paenibacillus cellulosilyticus]PWW06226.1 stage VI sporulation protein F [Paenibacillus cellulosilyticus]QKS43014.1 stage VI sporulation protein F [Paenibacillus cellulosilyticus]
MSYQKFGIRPDLVERVKFKMKNPVVKDRMKQMLANVNKFDLQDRAKVRKLVKSAAAALSENLTDTQEEQIITFILSQKIDPNNTFHLLKLWATFR